jgi:hypothetical protein
MRRRRITEAEALAQAVHPETVRAAEVEGATTVAARALLEDAAMQALVAVEVRVTYPVV